MHLVYILYSIKLNRFYIGFTSDFDVRIEFHKNAESHKFTANADDWELFLKIKCDNKDKAWILKSISKKWKAKLILRTLQSIQIWFWNSKKNTIKTVNQSPDSYRSWFEPKRERLLNTTYNCKWYFFVYIFEINSIYIFCKFA